MKAYLIVMTVFWMLATCETLMKATGYEFKTKTSEGAYVFMFILYVSALAWTLNLIMSF